MKFIPEAVGRSIAGIAVRGQKHSPSLLFGAGVASMVGSTVLACRATLQLETVLDDIEQNKAKAIDVKNLVDSDAYTGSETYTDKEMKRDLAIISTRGIVSIVKLYAPAVLLGGVGVICLTKSQSILKDRNAQLSAAYVAINKAFETYRERVVDKYGEEEDRNFRYGGEMIDVIDDETGKVVSEFRAHAGEPSGYARWFNDDSSFNYTADHFEYNWVFLRSQQNWANDLLRSRGHLFLNEVYSMLGLAHTSAGAIVGWVYDRHNEDGDNFVDFGCWEARDSTPDAFFEGEDGGILLDFNVDGPIWDLIDARRAAAEAEEAARS